MGDSRITSIISELSRAWIGKYGVWAVFDEPVGSKNIIKFLVKNLEKNRKKLPTQYKGIEIELEETEGISSF